jgi:hypothetical protein
MRERAESHDMLQPQAQSGRVGAVSYRRNGKLFSCEPVSYRIIMKWLVILSDAVKVSQGKAALRSQQSCVRPVCQTQQAQVRIFDLPFFKHVTGILSSPIYGSD